VSDVPIGAFISGGIDSSSIIAFMKKFSDNVKTFYVCSGDVNEMKSAEFISKYYNTEHNEFFVTAENFAENLNDMIWHYDAPLPWPSAIPLYFVSKLSKGKANVVLTGEGADELFAGYNRYYLLRKTIEISNRLSLLPKFMKEGAFNAASFVFRDVRYRKNLEIMLKKFNFDYATGVNALTSERERLLRDIPKENPLQNKVSALFNEKNADFLNKLLYLDFKTYLAELLIKQDKMGMAASIEARTPFLDYHIIEFAARIPSELKLRGAMGKYIFKKAMEGIVPKEIIYQKKRGFPVPIDRWFRKELHGFIEDELLRESGALQYFDKGYIKKLLGWQKRHNYSLQLWALLNFKLWHEQFLEK
jgi:asparagine synthase (glutamine-hydrolysing)